MTTTRTPAHRQGCIALVAAIIERAREDAAQPSGSRARAPRRGGSKRRPTDAQCPVAIGRPHAERRCAVEWLTWLEGITASIRPRAGAAIDGAAIDGAAEEIALRVLAHAA